MALLVTESPELERLIRAWPALPEALKAGILAMVEAATQPSVAEPERDT